MKKLFLGLILSLSSMIMVAETKTACFTVEPPMSCSNCENKIKENIRFEKGIKSVKPSVKEGLVEITYDDKKTDIEKIKNGFKKIGYNASLKEKEVCPVDYESPECIGQSCCAPVEVPQKDCCKN